MAKAKAAKEAKENAGATITEVVEEEKVSAKPVVEKKEKESKPELKNVTEAAKEKKPI